MGKRGFCFDRARDSLPTPNRALIHGRPPATSDTRQPLAGDARAINGNRLEVPCTSISNSGLRNRPPDRSYSTDTTHTPSTRPSPRRGDLSLSRAPHPDQTRTRRAPPGPPITMPRSNGEPGQSHPPPPDWLRAALAEHEAGLTRYAASLLGDSERARDVVQDTFLRLCRQPRHKVQHGLTTWLFTTCRRRALDVLKKESRMQPLTDHHTRDAPTSAPAPPDTLAQRETHRRLLRQLANLPDKQREVIRLKFQANLSYQQISEITGLKSGHVGYLIHHGLKRLREQLGAETGNV